MFKIREFSQLSQVSVKTLRYYDQIGLLKPAHTDSWTGYRYYAASQLLQLNHILAFKELGFTLEQIRNLLDEQLPCEQIRGMFRLKHSQLQTLIADEQARLTRIKGRLRQIEQEDHALRQHDVVLKHVESQKVVSVRRITASSSIPRLREELAYYLKQYGVSVPTTAPYIVLWHGCEECEDAIDLEVALPITNCLPETEHVRVYTLPGIITAASLMHRCHWQGVCCVSADLATWIEAHNYQVLTDHPRREIYLAAEEDGFYIADVQFAVTKQTIPLNNG